MTPFLIVKIAISILLITGIICGIGTYYNVSYEKILRPIAGIGLLLIFLSVLILVWIVPFN